MARFISLGLIGLATAIIGYIVGWLSGALIGATWWARKGRKIEEREYEQALILYELDRLTPWDVDVE